MKKITTKQLTMAASLLAICIAAQLFKNLSVFITGPIINSCIILAAIFCGLPAALILSCATPVTAFFITGSPIMGMFPLIMPLIMVGNAILAISVYFTVKKKDTDLRFAAGSAAGAVLKAAFMALTISYGVLAGAVLPEKMAAMLPKLQYTYSVVQLITAAIGGVLAFIIRIPLKKSMQSK